MADISIINKDSTDYNVKDAAGRLALAEVENKGAKNLLKNIRTTTTHKGITFTINDDGSVTANGTNDNTGASVLDINTQTSLALSSGDYILTGCPAGGSDSGYMMDITRSPGSSIKDTGSGATFTVGGDYTVTEFRIVISRNVTVDNLKFYPMLCTKAEWDISQTFVPYGKTNAELTGDISTLSTENTSQQAEINYAVNAGAKNILDYTFSINGDKSARTSNGVTFTINADRSISTSGTASANITSAWIQMNYVVPSDPVILSGCPAGGAYNKYKIDILNRNQTGSIVASDYGNGVVIKSSMFTNGIGLIRIRIEKGQNVDGLVFKPMIRPAAITDQTYEPYAPSNRELYEKVDGLGTELVANTNLDNLNIGTYYCGGATIGATLLNSPTHQPFRLTVSYFQSPTNRMQKIIDFNTSTSEIAIYIRVKTSSGWKSWYKFEGTEVT